MSAQPVLILAALALSIAATLPVHAADGFQAAANGAVAILPKPLKAAVITGGSLFCAEQRWTLRLRAERGDQAAPTGSDATLAIDDETFPAEAEQSLQDISIPLAREMLEALKGGSRLHVTVDGNEPASATFSLKGSRAVLEDVAPRCSAIGMSGYEPIPLTLGGPGSDAAKALLVEEVALFRQATQTEPSFASALLPIAGGRQLLFASLCGSTRYYGETGCKLVGYAAEPAGQWRPVYDTEGMLLYRDPNGSRDGWPNLATVPTVGGVEALTWSWDGGVYTVQDPAIAEETVLELRGSSSQ